MMTLKGRGVVAGVASGPALVTQKPMNFTAALSSPILLLPGRHSEIRDRHHELFKRSMQGTVMVFPACIGSTFTGMVLTQLLVQGYGPAAMVVQNADSLLVSGALLAEVWFGKGLPIVEYSGADLFDKIKDGARVEVDGASGEIKVS